MTATPRRPVAAGSPEAAALSLPPMSDEAVLSMARVIAEIRKDIAAQKAAALSRRSAA